MVWKPVGGMRSTHFAQPPFVLHPDAPTVELYLLAVPKLESAP